MTQPSTELPTGPVEPGPCRLKASFMCTGEAVQVRLDPMAMAPDSTVPNEYVPSCQACYDAQADLYLRTVMGR